MRIWALAKGGSKAGAVFLQGKASNGEWSINEPFACVETFSIGTFPQAQDSGIYHLKIDSQYGFPLEFVIRFESTAGPVYYDNNGSKNYQIIPYRRGVSAISVPQTAIFDMSEIVPCDLYATS